MEENSKVKDADDVDKIISAELPDKIADLELYELVDKYMMHCPCGHCDANAPCMKDGNVQNTSPMPIHVVKEATRNYAIGFHMQSTKRERFTSLTEVGDLNLQIS